jgi:glycosyltransferase involved in cell wall biosynthesis
VGDDVAVGDRSTLLVTPIGPARSGNGLAMRAGLLLEALAADGPVDVVVGPVSGPAEGDEWARGTARRMVTVPEVALTRADLVGSLGTEAGRADWRAREDLPVRAASFQHAHTLATVAALGAVSPSTVVGLRSYLAPLALDLARELGVPRVVVDADDDDERLLRDQGADDEADRYAHLARTWLVRADRVLAASPVDAAAMTERYGFTVHTLPNAVRPPASVSEPPARHRLLYVGNLTYAPNVDAVRDLVHDVLPRVRAAVPDATVDLVGAHDERLAELAGRDGVHLAGAVPDLAPWYARADLVVVPLRDGAGTRIKVLEAFAHRRPVVATPAAVSGLEVVDGESVHLGTTPAELTAHAVRLFGDPAEARRTVDRAEAVVAEHYLLDVVVPRARRLLIG